MIFRCSVVHVHESILIIYSTKTEFISTSGRSHSIWTLSRCGAKADLWQPVKTERSAGCGVLFVPAEPNVRNLWSRTTHLISATAFTKSNTKDVRHVGPDSSFPSVCLNCSWMQLSVRKSFSYFTCSSEDGAFPVRDTSVFLSTCWKPAYFLIMIWPPELF